MCVPVVTVLLSYPSGSKRKYPSDSNEDMLTKREEWSLRDVVFTDHVTNHKEGSVVKVDGNYVAVHYPPLDPTQLSQVNLASCRLLRKDELVVSGLCVCAVCVCVCACVRVCVCVCVCPDISIGDYFQSSLSISILNLPFLQQSTLYYTIAYSLHCTTIITTLEIKALFILLEKLKSTATVYTGL